MLQPQVSAEATAHDCPYRYRCCLLRVRARALMCCVLFVLGRQGESGPLPQRREVSPSLESTAFARHSAPAADGSCLAVLLSCGSSVDRFTISMGTQYNRACVPLTSVFKWATGSLRSLTNEEISKYLCHFFDFAGQAGELARNVALVQGTKSQMRGRSC